jgi:outer membrane protein assembly factor BamB
MSVCRWLVTCVCLLSVTVAMGAAPEWPQYRGANRDGKSSDSGINTDWNAKAPKLLWMADGLGAGFSSASINGDQLFSSGSFDDGQYAVCFDLKTQKVAWKTRITEQLPKTGNYPGVRSTPTLDGDKLYVVSSAGDITCMQQADGKLVWSRNFAKDWNGKMMSGWGFSESPLVDGDLLLCTPGAQKAMIVALDKNTGKDVWASEVPADLGMKGKDGAGYASIVISDAAGVKQYVTLVGRGIISVRAADGKFLWNYNGITNGTAAIPNPVPVGDNIFCSSGYGDGGSALLKISKEGDVFKAEEVYYHSNKVFQNHHGGMIFVDGHIYCGHGHNNGFPACLELLSGKIVWGTTERGPGNGSAAVLYVDGHLIFRYQSGKVALIEATTGSYKLKGAFDPEYKEKDSWAHPVVVNKKLYLREQDKLMCYDLAP